MREFCRSDQLFSLCGLNCGLCTMHMGGYCPGCGGGKGNQPCWIARCSLEQGGVEYCFQCSQYPCSHYRESDRYDSFITHRNRFQDMEKRKRIGPEAYGAEQREKQEILKTLLDHYNDGRKKTLFALAVNLLALEALREVMGGLAKTVPPDADTQEKAAWAAKLLQAQADEENILLKLRKKPSNR